MRAEFDARLKAGHIAAAQRDYFSIGSKPYLDSASTRARILTHLEDAGVSFEVIDRDGKRTTADMEAEFNSRFVVSSSPSVPTLPVLGANAVLTPG